MMIRRSFIIAGVLLSATACREEAGVGSTTTVQPPLENAASSSGPSSGMGSAPASSSQKDPLPADPGPALEGLINSSDTLASAKARLGDDIVVPEELDGPEGETFSGWVLYPLAPGRRIEVFLDESALHPTGLRVTAAGTFWTRADGVRIGMDSVELQALNGKPFGFSGFSWDYGGIVSEWHGGKLESGPTHHGSVLLCPPDDVPDDYPMGDAEFSSEEPRVLKHPAVVCEYGVVLGG
jgi:hypothetical protein